MVLGTSTQVAEGVCCLRKLRSAYCRRDGLGEVRVNDTVSHTHTHILYSTRQSESLTLRIDLLIHVLKSAIHDSKK